MKLVRMQRVRGSRGALLALAGVALTLVLGGCGSGGDSGSSDQQGEIEITCTSCSGSPSDPSLQNAHDIAVKFNEQYRGRYRIKFVKSQSAASSVERLQTYQRLALADDLPDVFQANINETRALSRTGKLMDFAPVFKDDPAWASTFHDGAFSALTDDAGHIWAVPQTRDAIGIYWNRAIFRAAGVSEFPRTWDEFRVACQKIEASGKTCFAMDGLWVTLLMWVNLIGTQPGADFLTTGIRSGDWSTVPQVVRATETLKQWHDEGFINDDAFSGEYQNAATAFISGQAAMIANGPWMVNSDIKTKNAVKGLYGEVGYEPSPGWTAGDQGLVVVAGEGSLASGAQDERKQEAVVAYQKFFTAHAQAFHQITTEGAYPAVKFEPTPAERKKLEPLGLALNLRASQVPLIYPHAFANSPSAFKDTWLNLWPAYVKGQYDAEGFLSKLASDAQSKTG